MNIETKRQLCAHIKDIEKRGMGVIDRAILVFLDKKGDECLF